MTVAAIPHIVTFPGAGSVGPFPFNFTFDFNSEIVCTITSSSGAVSVLNQTTDFTVTGAGVPTGGSVTTILPVAVGTTLTVSRILPLSQDASLPNDGPFYAPTIEQAFDRIVKMVQQSAGTLQAVDGYTYQLQMIDNGDGTFSSNWIRIA